MGKITLLVSREEMLHQAHNILQEKKYKIQSMKVIDTASAVTEARRSISEGASIIIARGLQASLIKQYTDRSDCSGNGAFGDSGKADCKEAKAHDRGSGIS